ncbi:hypothetical protein JW872_02635 [Candidatus Babeliales bacterium]|nr:hypothetical protein [Candidatus Babeliales bacterium]
MNIKSCFIIGFLVSFPLSTFPWIWTLMNDTNKPVLVVPNGSYALRIEPRQVKALDTGVTPTWWNKMQSYMAPPSFAIYFETNTEDVFVQRFKLTERHTVAKNDRLKISDIGRNTEVAAKNFHVKTFFIPEQQQAQELKQAKKMSKKNKK